MQRPPPGTRLDRKTAVKKNARWQIPEKTHKIYRKIDDFRGKASENRSETPVRKNRVCTHICGAQTREDPQAEHFRRKKPGCFHRIHFRGFRANTENSHDPRNPGSKVARKTRDFRVAAKRTRRKTPAKEDIGAPADTQNRTIFEGHPKKGRENACLRAGGRTERPKKTAAKTTTG